MERNVDYDYIDIQAYIRQARRERDIVLGEIFATFGRNARAMIFRLRQQPVRDHVLTGNHRGVVV